MKIRLTLLVPLVAVILSLVSCNHYQPRYISGVIWGTNYHITYNSDGIGQSDMTNVVTAILDSLDASFNAFNPSSELSRLNSSGSINASPRFLEVLAEGRRISALTDGAFDPTVGPLVDLWGFGAGSDKSYRYEPDAAALDSARAAVGFHNISIDGNRLTRLNPLTRLDFAAIAKGYAVDCVANSLSRAGCSDYLVEIGGEVRASGTNPSNDKWCIQIDNPAPDNLDHHGALAYVYVDDAAIATSGNYRNFRTLADGSVVAHTLDPATGRPAVTDVLSVSVIAASAMTADALATAAMVLGSERATQLFNSLSNNDFFGAIIVTSAGSTPIRIDSRHASVSFNN